MKTKILSFTALTAHILALSASNSFADGIIAKHNKPTVVSGKANLYEKQHVGKQKHGKRFEKRNNKGNNNKHYQHGSHHKGRMAGKHGKYSHNQCHVANPAKKGVVIKTFS